MPQKRLIGTDHNQVPTNAMLGSMAFQDSASVSVDNLALARGLATSPSLDFANDLDTGLYSPGDNQIALTTGGTERFRIDSSGRVGIGTTLPNEVLHVAGGGLRVAGQLVTASANSLGIDYASTSARFVSYGSDVGTQSGFVFITSNSTAGNTSERLRITSTGNVGIGITNPSAKLEVDGKVSVTTPATLSTTLGTGVSFVNASTKTYPTTANFNVTTGLEQNIELGTAQVINTVTPGGFNFVTGLTNTLTKSAGNTQDIERLYFNGFTQNFTWTDANTCKQYVGITDTFVYSGINANGRTSSSLNAKYLSLSPPNGGTQTIANATGETGLFATVNGTSGTVNITNGYGSNVSFETAARTSGSLTVTIGTYSFFGTSPLWGTSTSGTATNNTTITNLYGLRLTAPSSSTGLTVTNNWGISQEWALAKNYFAGNVGIGVTNPSTTLAVAGNTANILIGRQYTNANAITLNGSTAATDYNILSTSTNNLVINRPSAKTLIFAQADSTHAYFDTSNNLILSSGNLAMGNFTPSYAMDGGNATLNRAGRMGGLIFGTAGSSFPTMGYNAKPSGLNAWQYDISGDPASWIQFLNGSHIFYRASTGTAGAAITPLESVRFTSSGNVGIGTTNPIFLLDVAGSARLGAATGDVALEVGVGASVNRNALIDLVGDTTYSDYGLRIIRTNGGANADSKIQHRGTGPLVVEAQDVAPILFFNGGSERARIDSSGRLLVGTQTARSNVYGITPYFQAEGANGNSNRSTSVIYGENGVGGPLISFGKHRAATVGGITIVNSGDELGQIVFTGADGTNFIQAATVKVEVDGTPGANDMPGRLVFSTTSDGSATPTERLRITSAGHVLPGATNTYTLGASGNVWANVHATTFTGALSGNASTATTLQTARAINGVSFNGSADITITANTPNTLTLATSGTGLSGSATFNGSAATTFTVTSNATSANTASTIVSRDASGGFIAGTITASIQSRTAVTTYRDHTTTAFTDAALISRANTEDNWIYCDIANAQWGIYHRNIDSALVVAGQPTLPQNSIAFVGNNNLTSYVELATGNIYSLGNVSANTLTSRVATGTAPFTVSSTTVVTNLNADLLDGLQSTSFLRSDANNDLATGNFFTSAWIEAGRTSGSVSLTTNDGYGNANVAFNHRAGIPDVAGSSGRIRCDVDSAAGYMSFQLANSVTSGVAVSLSEIMVLTTAGVSITGTLTSSSTIQGTRLISTVATGTAPLSVTSTTVVTNLNADLLDGKNTGTSGNTIPLLDGANTWGTSLQTFSRGALGTTAGNSLNLLDVTYTNVNTSYVRFKATRLANGADWTTTSNKIVCVTDVTEQGYIEFNPNGGNYGIALGQGSSEYLRIKDGGNVGIGTTDPTTLLQVGSSPNLSYSYLRVTGSGSPNKFFRFLPLAVKSTAAGVADTPQSLYVGRFYNGVHKLHLFATGSNLEEGQTLTLHRNWGSSSVPIFLTRGGSDLTEVTFHYQNIDNDSYHVFISFTWIPAVPQGQGGNIRIDISSVSNVGTFDVPTTPTIPTLNSSNQIFAQGLNVSRDTGNVGVGTTNPSFKTDVNGDMRVQGTSRVRFGGTSTTSNFSIQYNSTANSLDFIVG